MKIKKSKATFKKAIKEIHHLNKLDKATTEARMCKLMEEVGELAQGINKTIGRKRRKLDETDLDIEKNILEEGVDSIQNILCILDGRGHSYKKIIERLLEKNQEWKKVISRVHNNVEKFKK